MSTGWSLEVACTLLAAAKAEAAKAVQASAARSQRTKVVAKRCGTTVAPAEEASSAAAAASAVAGPAQLAQTDCATRSAARRVQTN